MKIRKSITKLNYHRVPHKHDFNLLTEPKWFEMAAEALGLPKSTQRHVIDERLTQELRTFLSINLPPLFKKKSRLKVLSERIKALRQKIDATVSSNDKIGLLVCIEQIYEELYDMKINYECEFFFLKDKVKDLLERNTSNAKQIYLAG